MTDSESNNVCSFCLKGFPAGSTQMTALGKKFHDFCFCCNRCRVNLAASGQFVARGDAIICVSCAELEQKQKLATHNVCSGRCGRQILATDESIRAMNVFFHADCFRCLQCTSLIGDSPFVAAGTKENPLPLCVACSDKREKEVVKKCDVCHAPIADGPVLVAMGKQMHPTCFQCIKCRAVISTEMFSVIAEQAYCSTCADSFKKAEAKQTTNEPSVPKPICAICMKPVPDVSVETNGIHYCPPCFVCCHCSAPIDAGNYITRYPNHNKPWCLSCAKATKSSAVSQK